MTIEINQIEFSPSNLNAKKVPGVVWGQATLFAGMKEVVGVKIIDPRTGIDLLFVKQIKRIYIQALFADGKTQELHFDDLSTSE